MIDTNLAELAVNLITNVCTIIVVMVPLAIVFGIIVILAKRS